MTRVKIAVSLPPELVEQARSAVAHGRAPSVSGYVEAALLKYQASESFAEMIGEMLDRTGGPLTPEEIAWADEVLGR